MHDRHALRNDLRCPAYSEPGICEFMCVCILNTMHVCMHACMYVCMHACMSFSLPTDVALIYTRIKHGCFTSVGVWVYACMYICMYEYMYECPLIYTRMHLHAHTNAYIHIKPRYSHHIRVMAEPGKQKAKGLIENKTDTDVLSQFLSTCIHTHRTKIFTPYTCDGRAWETEGQGPD